MLALGCNVAQAVPVTWTFKDAFFDDGGQLTGSFEYDVDTNTYSNINIVTTAGSVLDGKVYNYQSLFNNPGLGSPSTLAVTDSADLIPAEPFPPIEPYAELLISFQEPITNIGTVRFLDGGYENFDLYGDEGVERVIMSGRITAVPIPAAVWLLGSGLGLLGWMKRRA